MPIDAAELREIIDRHGAALVLHARQWCYGPDDAVQEALFDLSQKCPTPEDPVGWIYQAVKWRAMNFARSEKRRAAHHRAAAEADGKRNSAGHVDSCAAETWFAPSHSAISTEELQSNIELLKPLDREILIARVWGDLSFAQISMLVERPLSTVHRRYTAALIELQQRLCEPTDPPVPKRQTAP